MKTPYKALWQARLLTGLLTLSLLIPTGVSIAQTSADDQSLSAANSAQFKAKMDRSKEKLDKARKQKKEAFPKGRHNMKNKKVRAELVRKLKEAEEAHIEAVRERAELQGLELSGSLPNGGNFRLMDFDEKGRPIYEDTMNVNAAITTAADQVRDNPTYQNIVQIQVEAELAYPNNHSGIDVETTTDTGGGQNVGYIEDGDWCEYTINVPATGQYRISLRTASNNNDGGIINLSIDGSLVVEDLEVPDTNGWQNWTTLLAYVYFDTTGSHTLRMDFAAGAPGDTGALFNLNWFAYNRTVIIGQWESNTARITHRELEGKVSVWDGSTPGNDQNHATHVAGTLVSRGINSNTLGMAPEASIKSFSSGNATSEMTDNGAAAPNTTDIHISNHSYGSTRGWRYSSGWTWQGEYTEGGNQEDFYDEDFGRYNSRAKEWDIITYNLPYYVMFVSAGNERENGPATGDSWTYPANFGSTTVPSYDPAIHPLNNRLYKGHPNGYDTMEGGGIAKNSIAVGSSSDGVDGSGNRDLGASQAKSYSCWGPADDGRIKPDIHGNGDGLTSSIASSDTATASYGGTSMSSPNVCGSAALLIDYYGTRFPAQAMRASTLKALILHTADDRGTSGPDYKYGWGLMNAKAAADVIKLHADDNGGAHMLESIINDTTTTSESHSFDWDGSSPLRVTICWTDPASAEINGHDNYNTKALVNDLNLKVTGPGGTHYPYVMPYVGDWTVATIDDPATTGINTVDNVEQVYLAAPAAGNYTITVDYVGGLTYNSQDYSLIVTGQALTNQPDAPTNLTATANGSTQIDLAWNAVSGATSYSVLRATSSGGTYTEIASGLTTTSTSDATASVGVPYYYVVRALNGAIESADSNVATATLPLLAPTGLTATANGTTQIDLAWNAVSGATSYSVLRATSSGGSFTEVANGLATTSTSDTPPSPGVPYYYVVRAINGAVESADSNEASATLPLDTPTGLTAIPISSSQIDLNWNSVTGATGYTVMRSPGPRGPYGSIASGIVLPSYSDTTGLTAGSRFYYRIFASTNAVDSSDSSIVSAVPSNPISPDSITFGQMAIGSDGGSGDAFHFSIMNSELGHLYQAQKREDLAIGDWINEGAAKPGNGGILDFVMPILETDTEYFYRIDISQQ